MTGDLRTSIEGTVVLWALSGALAILLGLAFAAGSTADLRAARVLARAAVHISRGIPTSLWVVAAGVGMFRLPTAPSLPVLFPGTLGTFQLLALGIAVALALGSAGHLAEIFLSARASLGSARLEQARLLALSRIGGTALIARECAAVALPATASRLVHHLHNTAFAALFPVTEIFGFVQARSNATFRIRDYVFLGSFVYVVLSASIWLLARILEAKLRAPRAPPRRMAVAP